MSTPNQLPLGELKRIIREDLLEELRWLLVGQTTWEAVRRLVPVDPHRDERPPDHLVMLAMNSAFVHGRTLLEFFIATTDRQDLIEARDGICQWPTWCPRWWPSAVPAGGQQKSSRLGLDVTSSGCAVG
jgi:hypothetical protein